VRRGRELILGDEDNYSSQEMMEEDVDLEKEVVSLGVKLAQAKNKLTLIDKENDVLREVRKDLKSELIKVNAKINESEILNKFLLENNSSRDELFEKIISQIKSLKQMKTKNQEKTEKLNGQIIEYLTEDQKEKELLGEQTNEIKDFLDEVKRQIKKLKLPNFENLVTKNIDLDKIKTHNEEIEKINEMQQNDPSQSQSKNLSLMRRSGNYNSTGNFYFYFNPSLSVY
jgi:chromosome segregation ATPase